jgi:hypothetical protein
MAHKYVNTASTAAVGGAGIAAASLSVTVTSFTGWPVAYPYFAEIAKGTGLAEIVEVTAAAGSVLTIVRGQGGTAAADHAVGAAFEHIAPASVFNLAESHPEAVIAHGTATPVVGRDDAQTLTNKTYRGAFAAVFSDALPAGVVASYLSTADNANARDGFVHANTAGNVDRYAFLATQAGANRVAVRNDGTVEITPSGAAVRPGFRNAGTSTLTGNVSAGGTLAVTGAATVGGTLGVTGAATVTGALTAQAAKVESYVSASGASVRANTTINGGSSPMRDLHQPLAKRVSATNVNLDFTVSPVATFSQTFTPRNDCHASVVWSCSVSGTSSAAANRASFGIRLYDSTGTTLLWDGGQPFQTQRDTTTIDWDTIPVNDVIDLVLDAGTTYQIKLWGQSWSGTVRLVNVRGTVTEVASV